MKINFTKRYLNPWRLTFNIILSLGVWLVQSNVANGTPTIPQKIAQLPIQPEPLPFPDLTPDPEPPESVPQAPSPDIPVEGESIDVERIDVIGSSIFTEEQFNPIINPLEGRSVSSQQLGQAVQSITQLYLNGGYLNSRAVLGAINGGIVTIRVIEGTIPDDLIKVEGTERLRNYVIKRIKLGISTPLNVRKLEDQLRLLKADPRFERVDGSLSPPQESEDEETTVDQSPEEPDELQNNQEELQSRSQLVVRVKEAPPFVGSTGVDNYSPPSIGGERFLVNLRYRQLSGLGDQVYASYRPRFQEFSDTYRVEGGYEVPVNAKNGTIGIRAMIEQNRVVNGPPSGIEELNINGNSQRYFFDYRQPLIRTPQQEFALSWGLRYYQGRTFIEDIGLPLSEGPDQKGISRTTVISFGQDYALRQPSGAWGVRSLLNFGIDALNATDNPDPIPDGNFFSWLLQAQRVQIINNNNLFIAQIDMQITPDSLLSAEQFVIGGGQSVRGYRQNILAGDNGFRFSLEDRITLVRNSEQLPFFTLAPFFDMGIVWNNEDNPNEIISDQKFIAGLGLGFIIQPAEEMIIRLDYAPPLIDVSTRGRNVQDEGFYFSINYDF
ncbi:MAG: ShlB/FhaC/HecB family hemolysin secretion/activation protein [Microcystaceae cyanobacterium]